MKRYFQLSILIFWCLPAFLIPLFAQSVVGVSEGQFYQERKSVQCIGFNLMDEVWKGKTSSVIASSLSLLAKEKVSHLRVKIKPTDISSFSSLLAAAQKKNINIIAVLTEEAFNERLSAEETTTPTSWDSLSLSSLLQLRHQGIMVQHHPTLFSWEIEAKDVERSAQLLQLLRSMDKQHLIAIAAEGQSETEKKMCQELNAAYADYFTLSLQPLSMKWIAADCTYDALPNAYLQATTVVEEYIRLAEKYKKPLVISACSYPRDKNQREAGSKTTYRYAFFSFSLSLLTAHRPTLAGLFFSTWAGSQHLYPDHFSLYHEGIYDTDEDFLQKLFEEIHKILN